MPPTLTVCKPKRFTLTNVVATLPPVSKVPPPLTSRSRTKTSREPLPSVVEDWPTVSPAVRLLASEANAT